MQEERAVTWGYTPVNATPFVGAVRDVFDEQQFDNNVFEDMPVRLKQPVPSNEVLCLPKDDIGKSCPQLMPPEPVVAPSWGTCGGFGAPPPGAGQPLDSDMLGGSGGDAYVLNFGESPDFGGLFFPGTGPQPPTRRPGPPARWHFPAGPGDGHRLAARPLDRDLGLKRGNLRLRLRRSLAGAVGSIRLGKTEFLRQGDAKGAKTKGQALQLSIAANIPPGGTDQQRRANEAGAEPDRGAATGSRLVALRSGRTRKTKAAVGYSRAQAAWWRRPGYVVRRGARVLSGGALSPYLVTRRLVVGPAGFTANTGVEIPPQEHVRNVRIATRLTLHQRFNRVLAFHAASRKWKALPRSRTLRVGAWRALAVTNAKGTRAIGVTLRDFPKPPAGSGLHPRAYYAVNATNSAKGTLLAVVHQVGVRGAQTELPARMWSYPMTFKVGTLRAVTRSLAALAVNLSAYSQAAQVGGAGPKKPAPLCRQPKTWRPAPPKKRKPARDTDRDGVPDWRDGDDDNDGVPDWRDADPLHGRRPARDTDRDGVPDWRDNDDDNDGVPDWRDSDPLHRPARRPARDTDHDGLPDWLDKDDDNDGMPDRFDPNPLRTPPPGFVLVRKCSVKALPRCRGCKAGDKAPRCKGCTACKTVQVRKTPKPSPRGDIRRVCTVAKTAVCQRRKCTAAKANTAACKPCVKCVWKHVPTKHEPVVAKHLVCAPVAAAKKLARCKGCTAKTAKLKKCKGCLRCKTVAVTTKPPGPAPHKRCAVKKTAACKGCKLGAAAGKCKGCTVCVPVPPHPIGGCRVRQGARCKVCKLHDNSAKCRGCTECPYPGGAAGAAGPCRVRTAAKCKGCALRDPAAKCRGCTVCTVKPPKVPKVMPKKQKKA
jgi:hypothetical protein